MSPQVQPLSYKRRFFFFYLLLGLFATSLPFLYLYATGYRFEWGGGNLVSTGGLYIAAERTGAEIYIDDELVRETRVFRRAFYAQGLNAGTHKVYVQKNGHHTWIKELPVYAHLVTEAKAFNLPLVPEVRVITPWQTPAGVAVLTATSSVLKQASSTNQILFEPRAATSTLVSSSEFAYLITNFEPTKVAGLDIKNKNRNLNNEANATTTKEWRGVRLFESAAGDIYASYVGSPNSMPYYYCAEPFPRYGAATSSSALPKENSALVARAVTYDEDSIDLPLQAIDESMACDPTIKIDRQGEKVTFFDFFPNSTDLVVLGDKTGAHVVEIDDRSWQNRQPLLSGQNLSIRVVNGGVYAYDGKVIYQVVINQNWF